MTEEKLQEAVKGLLDESVRETAAVFSRASECMNEDAARALRAATERFISFTAGARALHERLGKLVLSDVFETHRLKADLQQATATVEDSRSALSEREESDEVRLVNMPVSNGVNREA